MPACVQCQHELRPQAKYCGHCGHAIKTSQQVVATPLAVAAAPRTALAAFPCPPCDEIEAQMQLELSTRLNPLMNQERIKAMVMAIAAQSGFGAVGVWSDD